MFKTIRYDVVCWFSASILNFLLRTETPCGPKSVVCTVWPNRRVEARSETKTKQAQGTYTAWMRATKIALLLNTVTT